MQRTFGVTLPYVALATSAVWFWHMPDAASSVGPAVFLSSILLLGLPHGAVDHIAMARLAGAPVRSKRTAALVMLYLVLVCAVLALWLVMPAAVWVGFIVLTWFHWGQGDAWFVGRTGRASTIAARGALPMLTPLVFHPGEYLEVANGFIVASGHAAVVWPATVVLQLAAALIVALTLWNEVRQGGSSLLECVVLLAYFAVMPPILAIAIYFCFWHAPRHLVRLATEVRGSRWADLAWVLKAAIPLTLAAAVLSALVFVLLPTDDGFSVYLAVVAALTVPHVVVVCWQDVKLRAAQSQPE